MPDDGQAQRAYLDTWTYRFAGYTDYESMHDQVEMELFDWDTFAPPTDEQVRKEMAARLLEPENRLRAMMGLPAVDASTVVVVDETVDTKDPVAPPTSEPDAAANVKSTAEAGRIADSSGINGYDGIWHPADKSDGADAAGADLADDGGDGSSDDADSGPVARPPAEAAETRPTDTEPSTSAETTPAEH